jgi:hypothetical protein
MVSSRKLLNADIYRQSSTPLIINNSENEIMDMTLYEMMDLQLSRVDLIMGQRDAIITLFTIYISIITGYLITAFVAGKKLTRVQVLIASGIFLFCSSGLLLAMQNALVVSDQLVDTWRENGAIINAAKGLPPPAPADRSRLVIYGGRGLMLSSILASLYFMWIVRNSNDD